jgi:CHAT domain-containing protein
VPAERVIEYFTTADAIHAFVVTANQTAPAVVSVPCRYDDLAGLIRTFRRQSLDRKDANETANVLAELLLNPLRAEALVGEGDVLCIAPHRCLHGLPFSAIGTGSSRTVLLNPIAYVPSASLLPVFLSSVVRPGRSFVVVHNTETDDPELKQSFATEAESVARAIGAEIVREDAAQVAHLTELLPEARIVHFTCHASFDSRHPGRSGLMVSDGNGGDALLSVSDVAGLALSAELVVFGGCETARGDDHPLDDRTSLVGAALSAGARSVIAALWPVPSDAALAFHSRFYEEWLAGLSLTESVRRAQLQMAMSKRGDAPEGDRLDAWAPYVLVGSWR